ncbi:MAG: hypothetical protein M8354_12110 [Halalkalicoccus sp.]|nr:hypothetical protein [Halalkalicoccus sp.]
MASEYPETDSYGAIPVAIAAVVGVGTAFLSVWVVAGYGSGFEQLFRIAPTVENGGVGSDWVAGNTIPWLDFLIAITHAADVLLGAFILVMLFIHWASFRRLASRMRQPGQRGEATESDPTATDGGRVSRGARSAAPEGNRGDGGD